MNKNHVFSMLLLSLSSFSLLADHDDLLIQAGELVSNAAQSVTNNFLTILKNGKTPDVIDPLGQYPIESEVALGLTSQAVQFQNTVTLQTQKAMSKIQNGVIAGCHSMVQQLNHIADLEESNTLKSFVQQLHHITDVEPNTLKSSVQQLHHITDVGSNTLESSIQGQAWYEKLWNAEIAGYKGAGKYVIVATVATTALLTAYYLGRFDRTSLTLEQRVDDLIFQAQADPNIVIVELPKILALCKNEKMKTYVQEYVLKNIVITPEIQEAFVC